MPPARKSLFESVWIKILLVMIPCTVTVVGVMISLWADVRDMKSQRLLITDGRLVRLEEQQKAQDKQIEDVKRQLTALWARRRSEREPQ